MINYFLLFPKRMSSMILSSSVAGLFLLINSKNCSIFSFCSWSRCAFSSLNLFILSSGSSKIGISWIMGSDSWRFIDFTRPSSRRSNVSPFSLFAFFLNRDNTDTGRFMFAAVWRLLNFLISPMSYRSNNMY